MGSWDPQPADWNDYADIAWAPPHIIHCNSKWTGIGEERHDHRTVAEVRECFEAARDEAKGTEVWPCTWLLEGSYDDGSKYSYPCEAPTRFTDGFGSFQCTCGHDFVPAELRLQQGWDYAADEDEAAMLRRNGIEAVAMNGGSI